MEGEVWKGKGVPGRLGGRRRLGEKTLLGNAEEKFLIDLTGGPYGQKKRNDTGRVRARSENREEGGVGLSVSRCLVRGRSRKGNSEGKGRQSEREQNSNRRGRRQNVI